MTDDDLRKLWRDAGGSFHGPRVETGTMPEEKLLPFLCRLVGERNKLAEANAKLKADNKEMGQSFDLRWAASRRATEMWQAANPGNDLVWPDHADLCVWLLGQLASAREMRKRLDRRIRNQRIANRETWEIVESRQKWLGSDTARRSVIRHIGVIREFRAEIETMREAAKGQLVVVNVAQSEATLAKAEAAGAMSMLNEVRDECIEQRLRADRLQAELNNRVSARHEELMAEALAEIKASVDGDSDQPVRDIVYGLIDEIKALPDHRSALAASPSAGEPAVFDRERFLQDDSKLPCRIDETPPATPVQPTASVGAVRKEIMRLLREEFDPTPPGDRWSSVQWNDNAEEVAEKIVASLTPAPTQGDGDEIARLKRKLIETEDQLAGAWEERDKALALAKATPSSPVSAPSPAGGVREAFQMRVQPWMMACFGAEISADVVERNHRFLEEALELVQSTGCTASEAHQLVDYVFGREIGETHQEIGGVIVTLAALCLALGEDMHAAGETELARIWTKVEKIRAKQAAKPKHSPLPQHVPALSPATPEPVSAPANGEVVEVSWVRAKIEDYKLDALPGSEYRTACDDILEMIEEALSNPAPGREVLPVAWIERSVLAQLGKHRDATATVASGMLKRPFGDPVALYTHPATGERLAFGKDRDWFERKAREEGDADPTAGVPVPGEDRPLASLAVIERPSSGSVWRHHSGRLYRVLFIANDVEPQKPKYPATVVYEGVQNGKIWAGPLSDWHRRMTEEIGS